MKIREKDESILEYLVARNLLELYIKKKIQLEQDDKKSAQFKKRKPFAKLMFYFRINKKYRAIGRFKGDFFVITEISDHQ